MKMKSKTLGVEDVMTVLGIKQSRAYSLIKKLNNELKEQGYIVINGRIPHEYLEERLKLSSYKLTLNEGPTETNC
jgi:hypothetical protein